MIEPTVPPIEDSEGEIKSVILSGIESLVVGYTLNTVNVRIVRINM